MAILSALAARHAPVTKVDMLTVAEYVGAMGTCDQALTTTDASLGNEHQLRLDVNALWVLAPETAERATLEKDNCSDAWPIVNREPLNVKDTALHFFESFLNAVE